MKNRKLFIASIGLITVGIMLGLYSFNTTFFKSELDDVFDESVPEEEIITAEESEDEAEGEEVIEGEAEEVETEEIIEEEIEADEAETAATETSDLFEEEEAEEENDDSTDLFEEDDDNASSEVVITGSAPTIIEKRLEPSEFLEEGDTVEFMVQVEDELGINNIKEVLLDFSSFGGPVLPMISNGQTNQPALVQANLDGFYSDELDLNQSSSGDNQEGLFIAQYKISGDILPGEHKIPIQAINLADQVAEDYFEIEIGKVASLAASYTKEDLSIVRSFILTKEGVNPPTVSASEPLIIAIAVYNKNGINNLEYAQADLSSLDRDALVLRPNNTIYGLLSEYLPADNNVFLLSSEKFQAPETTGSLTYPIIITAQNQDGDESTKDLALHVKEPLSAESQYESLISTVSAKPFEISPVPLSVQTQVKIGVETSLFIQVRAENGLAEVNKVELDFSPLGGKKVQLTPLNDSNSQNKDETTSQNSQNEGWYQLSNLTIPTKIEPDIYSLPVVLTLQDGTTATLSTKLEIVE